MQTTNPMESSLSYTRLERVLERQRRLRVTHLLTTLFFTATTAVFFAGLF